MTAVGLALLAAGLALACPEGVDGRACVALDACIARVVLEPIKLPEGLTVRESALALTGAHFEKCALSAFSKAVTSSEAGSLHKALPAACAPCLCPLVEEPSCVLSAASLVTSAVTGALACGGCAYAASRLCGGP